MIICWRPETSRDANELNSLCRDKAHTSQLALGPRHVVLKLNDENQVAKERVNAANLHWLFLVCLHVNPESVIDMLQNNLAMNSKAADKNLVKQVAQQSPAETLKQFKTSEHGLSAKEAARRLEQNGPNQVATKKHNTKIHFLVESFFTPFTMVLLILATISLFTDYVFVPAGQKDLSTVIIMITMILISGLTSFIQNVRTNDAVEDLLNMVSVTTNIRRDQKDQELPTKQVVIGDIINIHAGDMVPADIRLLKTKDLFCSSSSLNGESTPVEKIAAKKPDKDHLDDYLDYPDVLYEGTTIVSGAGVGVVFATGEHTVFGKLAKSISKQDIKETNFDVGIKNISKLLLTMTAIIAPLVLIINGLTKGNWLNALLFAIATAVGLTPEMLPVIVTSNLVKGSLEMSKHGTIVKKMNSIQNFGAADILCTDKTGTLTQDKVVLERHYNLKMKETPEVLRLAYLNAYFQTGMRDLMDKAVIDAANDELDVNEIQHNYTKVDEIPFDFERRRMSVVVKQHGDGRLLVTKGAAEEMLKCCDRIEIGGKVGELTQDRKNKIMQHIQDLNEDGLRVILLAYQHNPAEAGEFNVDDEKNLVLVGFLAFLDPPKDDVKGVLKQLKRDGISVKILTGDNAAVTKSVAKRVGLDTSRIYSQSDFVGKSAEEMKQMVENCSLFVKLSPQLKAEIIKLLKKDGHTVAYMGDGINDTPAMKAADVGISVDTAVDIAKKSADIILLRKSLLVLEHGVRIGRLVFGNTMKYIKITLSSNFGNILSILVASSFLPFLPMLPVQLLILDLIYGTSCLSLPFDTMNEKYLEIPREWETKKLPKFMFYFGPTSSIFDIITFALLYFWICPATVGVSYVAASAAQKAVFMAIFWSGWFIESLWTQEMVIQALRDPAIPFIQQHSSAAVMFATIGAGLLGTAMPFIPKLADAMRFGAIPVHYLAVVFCLLFLYICLTTLVKHWYLRKERFLI